MSKETVSIIIPIYNCEKYLERCIESVTAQSFSNIEILLIDDGSTDRSGVIGDRLAAEDNRIRIYHINNSGVSVARNYGLNCATGDWIQFVDSDDYIEKDMTEYLVREVKEKSVDCVVCGFIQETPYRNKSNVETEKPLVYSNKEYFCNILEDPLSFYYGVVWNKMYRKDIIDQYEMSFDTNQKLGEDFLFTLEYLKHIDKLSVISRRPYHYNCLEQNSLSRYQRFTVEKRKMELENRTVIYHKLKECAKSMQLSDLCKTRIYWYLCHFYLIQMNHIRHGCDGESKAEIERWKGILRDDKNIKESLANVPKYMIQKEVQHLKWNDILGKIKRPIKKIVKMLKS